MKRKKKILMIVSIPLVFLIVYSMNAMFGNPISKGIAKKEVLTYYEEKYNKEFHVYSIRYNFLIPDYNIRMAPSDDKDAIFETSRYELQMFDAYGAYLASSELESKILNIVKEYPNLKFTIQAEEEHHIEVAGVEFDFFTSDPRKRLTKNYFMAKVSWVDTGLGNDETTKLMDEIALKVNTELKGTPMQLLMDISVKDTNGDLDINQRSYVNGKAIIKK